MEPTIDRINSGGTNPLRNDGSVFHNRIPSGEAVPILPAQPVGIYREYVVPTPGVRGPGPMRIVTGGSEMWFTLDHYGAFIPIR